MKHESIIFMVEGGQAFEMVQAHIAERKRVREANRAMGIELGVETIYADRLTGVLTGVLFGKTPLHSDFRKPNRKGVSYPRKGTEWARRLSAQVGYPEPAAVISKTFGVPLSLSYKTDDGKGWRCIGRPFAECGWLYISKDGPYAMWIPDVEAEVADELAQGHTVEEPARSFKPEFNGCRRIEPEEWEILVAQNKLAKKHAAS